MYGWCQSLIMDSHSCWKSADQLLRNNKRGESEWKRNESFYNNPLHSFIAILSSFIHAILSSFIHSHSFFIQSLNPSQFSYDEADSEWRPFSSMNRPLNTKEHDPKQESCPVRRTDHLLLLSSLSPFLSLSSLSCHSLFIPSFSLPFQFSADFLSRSNIFTPITIERNRNSKNEWKEVDGRASLNLKVEEENRREREK